MKKILRKLVLLELKALARRRLKRFTGKIIAVTGSTGKTGTKDAIYAVLNTRFRVKTTKKSMNSEFGLPLTILDIDSGFSSATKWSWYLLKGFFHSFMRDHSDVLLLEMGVDKPGDMDFLLSIVKPDIAVFTNVAPVHLDEGQFKDLQEIFEEKSKLISALGEKGIAVLNIDDDLVASIAKKRRGKRTVTFGKKREGDFWAGQVEQSLEGLHFVLHHDTARHEVHSRVIGDCHVYMLLPAIICGSLMDMEIADVVEAIKLFSLPPGRMSVIPAINGATILDSSYNSSPVALKEALLTLKVLGEKRRKVAVLGNMNELGKDSEKLHEGMAGAICSCADVLITVGKYAKLMALKAVEKGFPESKVHHFNSPIDAAEFFKDHIVKNDLILVKGSQNRVRLERFVKEIMAFPEDSRSLLVRQERVWSSKL